MSASLSIAKKSAPLTVDGTATGLVGLANTNDFFVGATANIYSSAAGSAAVVITSTTGGKLGLRLASSPGTGNSDMSAYLVADGAMITQPAQVINRQPESNAAAATGAGSMSTTTSPTGLVYVPGSVVTLSSCAANGSTTTTLPAGDYEVACFNEDVYFDFATTVATGGMRIALGQTKYIHVAASTSVAGRSAGATGDLQFTPYSA